MDLCVLVVFGVAGIILTRRLAEGSADYYRVAVSKRDLKPSGMICFRKFAYGLGFACTGGFRVKKFTIWESPRYNFLFSFCILKSPSSVLRKFLK